MCAALFLNPLSHGRLAAIFATAAAFAIRSDEPSSNAPMTQSRRDFDPYTAYADAGQRKKAVAELRACLGQDKVTITDQEKEKWSRSDHSTVNSGTKPDAVTFPTCTEDVVSIVKIASRYKVPVVPISGQTSLEGSNCTTHGGIVITFKRMNRILGFYPEDEQATVQPGLSWVDFNNDDRLTSERLFFPVDPGPGAQFGGMAGTNCSGTNAIRYSTMRNWVVNLTLVTMDGRKIKTGQRAAKTSAGYSLKELVVGSEGTLGIVTEMTVKLATTPEMTRVAVASFKNCHDAISAALKVRRKVNVQCLELMDETQMRAFNADRNGKYDSWPEEDSLFMKFSGRPDIVEADVTTAEDILRADGALHLLFAKSDKEAEMVWKARKDSLWAMQKLAPKGHKPFSTDVCVPRSRLAEIIQWSRREMDRQGFFASILGHIGDGNFHCSIFYGPGGYTKVKDFNERLVEKARHMEGTCTGEHGIGIGKMAALRKELGDDCLDIMRSIKRSLDPDWLLNAGKVIMPTSEHPIIQYDHWDAIGCRSCSG